MRKSNYDKYPATRVEGELWKGWQAIREKLAAVCDAEKVRVLVVECYQGVYHEEIIEGLKALAPALWIDTRSLFKSVPEIEAMTYPYVTDDRLFGFRSNFTYDDFFDPDKRVSACERIRMTEGLVVVYGHGAATLCPDADKIVYVDMARWEIQLRSRRHEIDGLGVENRVEGASFHYKRGYFVDWLVCDRLKKRLLPKADYWLDTHRAGEPKMITGETLRQGLTKTARQPFRVVPFFDPAPWGGQWMKAVCGLDPEPANYGWCFDCVPEENSLYFNIRVSYLRCLPIILYSTRREICWVDQWNLALGRISRSVSISLIRSVVAT